MSYDIEVAKLIIVVVGIIFLQVGGVCLPLIWNKDFGKTEFATSRRLRLP